ncbi:MAG: nucleotide-binding domain containing protein [Piscinibacter sp.]
MLAVSGSASPLSALQIEAALAAGFVDLPVDARALVADEAWPAIRDTLVESACAALAAGRSVMLHSARGPQDQRIAALLDALQAAGGSRDAARHEGGRRLGQRLGEVVDAVLRRVPLRRLLLSGGDTSSHITQALAPQALRIEARLAPGAPLCRCVGGPAHVDGLQLGLKGGQMGTPDYFVRAWRGPSGDSLS